MLPIILGEGNRIIKQYPSEGTKLNMNSKVFLLTNNSDYKMIDINKWSKSDVKSFCDMINLNCIFEGYGYVKKYSIKSGDVLTGDTVLNVILEPKYVNSE